MQDLLSPVSLTAVHVDEGVEGTPMERLDGGGGGARGGAFGGARERGGGERKRGEEVGSRGDTGDSDGESAAGAAGGDGRAESGAGAGPASTLRKRVRFGLEACREMGALRLTPLPRARGSSLIEEAPA